MAISALDNAYARWQEAQNQFRTHYTDGTDGARRAIEQEGYSGPTLNDDGSWFGNYRVYGNQLDPFNNNQENTQEINRAGYEPIDLRELKENADLRFGGDVKKALEYRYGAGATIESDERFGESGSPRLFVKSTTPDQSYGWKSEDRYPNWGLPSTQPSLFGGIMGGDSGGFGILIKSLIGAGLMNGTGLTDLMGQAFGGAADAGTAAGVAGDAGNLGATFLNPGLSTDMNLGAFGVGSEFGGGGAGGLTSGAGVGTSFAGGAGGAGSLATAGLTLPTLPGFTSDLPAWAGGAGGTTAGAASSITDYLTQRGVQPGDVGKVVQAVTGGGAAAGGGGTGGGTGGGGGGNLTDIIRAIIGGYAGAQTNANLKPNLPGSIDTALFNAAQANSPNFAAANAQQLRNINGEYLDPTKNLAVQGQLQALNDQFTSKTLPGAVGQFYGKNQAGPAYENSAFANPFTSKSGAPNSILGNLSADLGRAQGQSIQQGYTSALSEMNRSGLAATLTNTPFQNMNTYAKTAYEKPIFQTDPLVGAIMGGLGAYGGTGGGSDPLKTGLDWLGNFITQGAGDKTGQTGIDMTGFKNDIDYSKLFNPYGSDDYSSKFTGLGNDLSYIFKP